ncbi:hypothetical protein R3P38DRAFT_3376597 [Favolaschia claudopus]|uniref:RRM domain-containing protein n=1 Tax=Favolaschia claudopus TaxID=2862362 RepID=A0AAV9ZEW7_9AGAR
MITPIPSSLIPPTSLLWTDLEPWMDAEYARQVCALMRWDAVAAVPPSSANSSNNNAGYCVLTFGNSASAAVALTHYHEDRPVKSRDVQCGIHCSWGVEVVHGGCAVCFAVLEAGRTWTTVSAEVLDGGWGLEDYRFGSTLLLLECFACLLPFPVYPSATLALWLGMLRRVEVTVGEHMSTRPWRPNDDAQLCASVSRSLSTRSTNAVKSPPDPPHPHPHPHPHASAHTTSTSTSTPAPPPLPHATSPARPTSSSTNNSNGSDTASANGGISPAPLSPGYSRPVPSATGIAMDAAGLGSVGGGGGEYAKEYSIFVGDLAPETSNSDLVLCMLPSFCNLDATLTKRMQVFRNPVLGVEERPPFASCKSAKIMLDPVTGVSRGYGFVRFTDEADQQRALIEMHGLYCLSRPMRVSLATAKFKPPPPSELSVSVSAPGGHPSVWLPTSVSGDQHPHQPSPYQPPPPSVSAPIAGHYPNGEPPGYTPKGGLITSASGSRILRFRTQPQRTSCSKRWLVAAGGDNCKPQADEWRHTAQGCAILGNLIGPNGEQLTSTDPYNTTVFVGGLSPLVDEDTLRTFFVPFGEIHYVKVPFVRKADAERAIGKMQGFPVGGSRIRLSWGRSQYKAAKQLLRRLRLHSRSKPPPPPTQQMPVLPQQIVPPIPPAAAVASSAAGANVVANGITPAMPDGMTHEQAVALLQKFQMQGFAAFSGPPAGVVNGNGHNGYGPATTPANENGGYAGMGAIMLRPRIQGVGGVGEGQSNGQQQAQQQQQPHFTDESRTVQEGPFGDAQDVAHEVVTPSTQVPTSSFSPFWPDPHQHGQQQQHQQQQAQQQQQQRQPIGGLYAAAELLGRRRDTNAGMMPYGGAQRGGLGVPTGKSYTPSFFPVQPSIQTSGGSAAVPICGRGGYGGSPPAFQVIRYQEPRPISRPGSGAACGAGEQLRVERIVGGELLFDPMHDLNGTLVSLDLNREREREYAWGLKSPTVTESASAESTSSGGSVQFRMSMESP